MKNAKGKFPYPHTHTLYNNPHITNREYLIYFSLYFFFVQQAEKLSLLCFTTACIHALTLSQRDKMEILSVIDAFKCYFIFSSRVWGGTGNASGSSKEVCLEIDMVL